MGVTCFLRRIFSQKLATHWGLLASLLLFFLLAKPIFGDYFSRPNSLSYAFGGDALALYYNIAFHARYGDGAWLRSTNYPDGEYIYLTDAQGAVSNALQLLRRMGADVSAYAVGIVHSLNLYLLFAAVAVVFWLLQALGCRVLTSALFAPLIVLLSPQVLRISGHFGLAYPVAIPLAMLWFLRKYRVQRWEGRDVLFALVSLFFTYNNPYIGLNINLMLACAGAVMLLWHRFRRPYRMPGVAAVVVGAGCLLWVFADFWLNDPVHDRVSPQWGFFFFQARAEGLFYPPGSLLHDWLTHLGVLVPKALGFETLLNVGAVSTLAVVVGLLLLPWQRRWRLPTAYVFLLGASLMLLLIAANTSALPISPSWIEEHLRWLLMFKAAARLAWPFYFVFTLAGVCVVDALSRALSFRWLSTLFLLAVGAGWNAEINQYIVPHFRNVFHANFLSREHEAEVLDVLRANRINPADFQAILAAPRYAAWSDKVWPHLPFESQFWSLRLSLATGLPVVNPLLSRVGTQHIMERLQMLAHPLVERGLLAKFPNSKDLLLLVAKGEGPLQTGERYVESLAERLAETPRYALYRLRLADLARGEAIREAQERYAQGYREVPALHLSFDEQPSETTFYGRGSQTLAPGEHAVATFSSPYDCDTTVVFSAWSYADAGRWNACSWLLAVRTDAGEEILRETLESRRSNDVQGHYWFRTEKEVYLPHRSTLFIAAVSDRPMRIDEVMLWPKGARPLVALPDADGFLQENFWVKKPQPLGQ